MLAAFSEGENRIYLWDLNQGKDIREPFISLFFDVESGVLFFIKNNSIILKALNSDIKLEKEIKWEYGNLNNASIQFDSNKLILSSRKHPEGEIVWDLTNELTNLPPLTPLKSSEPTKSVNYFRFSPKGKQLAFIFGKGEKRQVGLWYLDADTVITPQTNVDYYATGVGFNGGQIRLALGKKDDIPKSTSGEVIKVQGWQGQDEKDLVQPFDQKKATAKTYFSYANRFRAVIGLDQLEERKGSVHLLNRQGRRFAILQGGQDEVDAIGFSNTQQKIVVTAGRFDDEQLIKIWDLDFEKIVERETHFKYMNYKFTSLSFSGDAEDGTIAATTEAGMVHFFDLKGHQQIGKTIDQPDVLFTYVSSRAKGIALVGKVGDNYGIYLYDSEKNTLDLVEGSQTPIEIESVTHSQDGKTLAVLKEDNIISTWDLSGASPKALKSEEIKGDVLDIRFNNDGDLSFVFQEKPKSEQQYEIYVSSFHLDSGQDITNAGNTSNRIRVIDPSTKILATELDPSDSFVAMVFDSFPDRPIEDEADYPQTVLLTTRKGKELLGLDTDYEIRNMTFHSSGELLATIGSDGAIKLWELGGLEELMDRGCNWLQWYLQNDAANLTPTQRDLCSEQ